MTKARDLAGFASSSVTTTASDGLVLKGDGSSTDVVIKNGANATVASVADGTVNIAAAGSITATGASIGALARGAIQIGNSSGVAAPLTIGSNTQLLRSNGTTAAWATVSSDPAAVVFPSNWASPTNTYTSSGTWSKGSLSDDAYVWFFLLGGGSGGAEVQSGIGGSVRLVYGKAGLFNGSAYVVGAARAGTDQNVSYILGNPTTLTLTSGKGSSVFDTPTSDTDNILNVVTSPSAAVDGTYLNGSPAEIYGFQTKTLPSGYENSFTGSYGKDVVFGGGRGQAPQFGGNAVSTSLLSGNGGTTASINGVSPGGGGAAGQNAGNTGGTGAAGNVRVYHV